MLTKQRILVVAPLPPPLNGQSVVSQRVTEELGAEALTVSLTPRRATSRLVRGLFFAWVLVRLVLARFRRDVTHVYFTCSRSRLGGLRDIALLMLFSSGRYCIVNHVHGSDLPAYVAGLPAWWRRIVRARYARIDISIALTPRMASDLRPNFRRVEVVGNSYPSLAESYAWEHVRASKTGEVGPATPLRVVLLSSLMYSKGVLALLDAAKLLRDSGMPLHLEVVGSFESDEYGTRKQIRAAVAGRVRELAGVVAVRGHVSDTARKLDYLLGSDVFCLPTFYRSEGAPLSVIEAMSVGCAVVTTGAGYLDEVVPEAAGWRIREASARAVAEALAEAGTNNAMRHAKQAAAYQHARRHLSPQDFASNIRRVFKSHRDWPH